MEMELECPECGDTTVFYRTASMWVHLGLKSKWDCENCGYGIVQFNGEISSVPS